MIKQLTVEAFPEAFRIIAEIIGVSEAIKLCQYAGGTQIYVPKLDWGERIKRNEKIVENFKAGVPYEELAKRYDLTVSSIYRIVQTEYFNKHITVDKLLQELDKDK